MLFLARFFGVLTFGAANLSIFAILDLRRAALFLWINFFLAALSRMLKEKLSAFSVGCFLAFFTAEAILFLRRLFTTVRRLSFRKAFLADVVIGILALARY